VARAGILDDISTSIYLCNEAHRFTVAEQLELSGSTNHTIILEPIARNTAVAVAVATLHAIKEHPDDDPELLVMPSDHVIKDVVAFKETIVKARQISNTGALVCLGVAPTSAHTGYGYIKCGTRLTAASDTYAIDSFVEKPNLEKAKEYLCSGEYLWNSGMLLFKASAMIGELEIFAPDILDSARKAIKGSNDDLDFCRLSAEALESCPSMSIDCAVMERTTRGAIVPLEADWNDIGSWDAVWDVSEKDAQGNACKGNVYLQDTRNSLVLSEKRLVTLIGVKDLVVVETRDSILITDRVHSEKVKGLVEGLNSMGHEEVHDHRQVHRPWGWYDSIDEGSRFKAKRIMVKPGEKLSLQKHHHRAEHWVVVKGTAVVECDDQTLMLGENESTFIPLGALHRLSNPGQIPLEIIEVQSGSYLGEDDIVRLQDDYGRTENIHAPGLSRLIRQQNICELRKDAKAAMQ
jgi:mannose-1-phosphate guanylyltransferase/mannose-6-phosphate isomerase